MNALIKITPFSQRAKNRTKEHGELMELLQNKGDKFLAKSLHPTSQGECWLGWFTEKEATFKFI